MREVPGSIPGAAHVQQVLAFGASKQHTSSSLSATRLHPQDAGAPEGSARGPRGVSQERAVPVHSADTILDDYALTWLLGLVA